MNQVSAGAVAPEPRLRLVRDQAVLQPEPPPIALVADRALFTTGRPLVVDLDGTLVRSDLLIETAFSELGRRPQSIFEMVSALFKGKAALKHRLAEPVEFDASILPYDDEVLGRIREARLKGRPVYLASASNRRLVEAVARHLNLFTGWFASDSETNLAGAEKARRLVDAFGKGGFDYIGNDAADLPVWEQAQNCYAIRASNGVSRRLSLISTDAEHLPHERADWRVWARLFRVHQYAKNALVFVPLLAAHAISFETVLAAALAFVAFSLCASGVYLLNDLVDLRDDRLHHSKCYRPLASGAVPLHQGLVAVPLLFVAAFLVAAAVSLPFMAVLLGYLALTTAYSLYLKRKMMVDVITLAGLYTIRVIGGAIAAQVAVSHWLLAFSLVFFVSLALLKRFVELTVRLDANRPDAANRDYKTSDIPMILALAAGAGFNAVTIFALYISSDTVLQSYRTPEILWLVCPMLLFWIGRALLLAQRRSMPDDPVVFALKDKVSLISMVMVGGLVVAAV